LPGHACRCRMGNLELPRMGAHSTQITITRNGGTHVENGAVIPPPAATVGSACGSPLAAQATSARGTHSWGHTTVASLRYEEI
jgi:hypothetical protein